MTRQSQRPWHRLHQDRRGSAALEAAIVITALLAPLLALLVGVGQAMLTQYRVDRATHAALLYAWGTPATAMTTSNVTAAAQAGYGTGSTMTPTAAISCYCMDQTGTRVSASTTAVSCTGTCSVSGQVLARWVTVTSSASFTPLLKGPWDGKAWTLQNSSTVRIQ